MNAIPHIRHTDKFHTDSVITDELCMLHIDLDTIEEDRESNRENSEQSCVLSVDQKNVLRKQRHWERSLASKRSKRRDEKTKRKQNRTDVDNPQFSKRVTKAITKERLAEAQTSGPKLCLDLSMTDNMSDKEISRLASQIRRLYGSNRKATRPFHLYLAALSQDSRLYRECLRMNDGFHSYVMDVTEVSCLDLFPPENVTYLTPDAEEALERIEPDKVYVLGGLVDESIQRKITYMRAKELNVRTARLPIDEYMVKKENPKNFYSKILSINQVLDILLTLRDTGSWIKALQAWFPPGKGFVVAPEAANHSV
ncbi:tRNA methyltransferase 10 homolog B [Hypomesus transpacificus]|uniref:tRNA methyltransferase 10 homolog B n=1 Tax=Hypomesus transpacificus TaxID=137520 RepID=UPI001F07ADE5|nr:tRNA methyltransferase 10 homolog B [Hypomesus transpacificus]